jgi:haloalkane dehalogenase
MATLRMLHGNPTYSFLCRHLIARLRHRFRCLALDYPGFGLSTAAPGYTYTPGEHSAVVSAFVQALDLQRGNAHFERFSRIVGGRWGGLLIRHFNAFVNVLLPFGIPAPATTSRKTHPTRSPPRCAAGGTSAWSRRRRAAIRR